MRILIIIVLHIQWKVSNESHSLWCNPFTPVVQKDYITLDDGTVKPTKNGVNVSQSTTPGRGP